MDFTILENWQDLNLLEVFAEFVNFFDATKFRKINGRNFFEIIILKNNVRFSNDFC